MVRILIIIVRQSLCGCSNPVFFVLLVFGFAFELHMSDKMSHHVSPPHSKDGSRLVNDEVCKAPYFGYWVLWLGLDLEIFLVKDG